MKNTYPRVLFSTQTKISILINENYYNNLHFMYCSPWVGYPVGIGTNLQSSTPIEKYNGLHKDSVKGDFNGVYISTHRSGLLTGVEAKINDGTIDIPISQEIIDIIKKAPTNQYRPILCQIIFEKRIEKYISPNIYPADPFSQEYILKDLPGIFINKQYLEDD